MHKKHHYREYHGTFSAHKHRPPTDHQPPTAKPPTANHQTTTTQHQHQAPGFSPPSSLHSPLPSPSEPAGLQDPARWLGRRGASRSGSGNSALPLIPSTLVSCEDACGTAPPSTLPPPTPHHPPSHRHSPPCVPQRPSAVRKWQGPALRHSARGGASSSARTYASSVVSGGKKSGNSLSRGCGG